MKDYVKLSEMKNDNPLKRFAVVRITSTKRMNFRVWYLTLAEAEEQAEKMMEKGSMFVVVETQTAFYKKTEYMRKFKELKYNDVDNFLTRKEAQTKPQE